MSVISGGITELSDGRTFNEDQNNIRTYTRVFQVITDDVTDGQAYVANSLGLPKGTVYSTATESDSLAVVISKNAVCNETFADNGGNRWIVTVNYGPDENAENQNPINQPPDITYDGESYVRGIDADVFGVPITTSAGMPLDQQIEIDDSRPTITITRNEATYNDILADYYRDSINADWFKGRAPGTVKCRKISAREIPTDNTFGVYYSVTYVFETNVETWDLIILDQGYHYYDQTDNKVKNIYLDGVKPDLPVALDGAGGILPVGGQPVFRTHKVYQRLPFSVFGF